MDGAIDPMQRKWPEVHFSLPLKLQKDIRNAVYAAAHDTLPKLTVRPPSITNGLLAFVVDCVRDETQRKLSNAGWKLAAKAILILMRATTEQIDDPSYALTARVKRRNKTFRTMWDQYQKQVRLTTVEYKALKLEQFEAYREELFSVYTSGNKYKNLSAYVGHMPPDDDATQVCA